MRHLSRHCILIAFCVLSSGIVACSSAKKAEHSDVAQAGTDEADDSQQPDNETQTPMNAGVAETMSGEDDDKNGNDEEVDAEDSEDVDMDDQDSKSEDVSLIYLAEPDITGNLTTSDVAKVTDEHRDALKTCYTEQLKHNSTLAGDVLAQFTIAPSGSVVAAKIKRSTLKNVDVESCIASTIRRWVLPKPEGGGLAIVEQHINYAPK